MLQLIGTSIVECCPCGKRCFHTEGQAKLALAQCQRNGREEKRYYRCTRSSYWHLTSQAQPRQAA